MKETIKRPHLPSRLIPTLLFFCLVGIALYVLPLWNAPGHDAAEWYRYWAAPTDDPAFWKAMPPYMKQTGYVPAGPLEFYLHGWYPQTERYDILNIISIWWGARLDGINNGWRAFVVLSAALSLGLLYLMMLKLDVSRSLSMLLVSSLFFLQFGWIQNTQSEPRALPWMMLALYLALTSDRLWAACLGAAAMLVAVLVKETFALPWLLVPALMLYRQWGQSPTSRKVLGRKLVLQLIPHLLAGVLWIAIVLYIRGNYPVTQSYIFTDQKSTLFPVLPYWLEYFQELRPSLTLGSFFFWDKIILLLLLALLYAWFFRRQVFWAWIRSYTGKRFWLIVGTLLLFILIHPLPYYLAFRFTRGNYVIPANMFAMIVFGLFVTPFLRLLVWPALRSVMGAITAAMERTLKKGSAIRSNDFAKHTSRSIPRVASPKGGEGGRRGISRYYSADVLFLIVVVIAVIEPLYKTMSDIGEYWAVRVSWKQFTEAVDKAAPPGSHLVIEVPSVSWGEPWALMVHLLASGRYDLVAHLGEYPAWECEYSPSSCQAIDNFNALQPPLPEKGQGTITYVSLTGGERPPLVAPLPKSHLEKLKLLVRSPLAFSRAFFMGGITNSRCDYLIHLDRNSQ